MSAPYHQTVGFHFKVNFGSEIDAAFQSVSGLDVSFDTESFKEAGENRFEHVIPTRRKYSDLVLKRGLLSPTGASELSKWCKKAFDKYQFEPKDLTVMLLDEKHNPLYKWDIKHAWPKAWKMSEMNAEKGEVFIETFELNYNTFTFT